MACGAIAGVPGLTPRVASAAMALVAAKIEKQFSVVAFSTTLTPLGILRRASGSTTC